MSRVLVLVAVACCLAIGVAAIDRKVHRILRARSVSDSAVEVDAHGNIETETGIEHVATVENALEAFKAEMDSELEAHRDGAGYQPFWGRTPECCLSIGRHDYKNNELVRKCTVYSIWQCFPVGRICEEDKPGEEPKPMTYTVTTAKNDASLGSLICNSNCAPCLAPRKNDINPKITGSLKNKF